MSANNFILIKWRKTRYEISHRDADTGYRLEKLGKCGTLEEAVKTANEFMCKNVVEYGLQIIPRVNWFAGFEIVEKMTKDEVIKLTRCGFFEDEENWSHF